MLAALEDKILDILVRNFCEAYFDIDEHIRRPKAPNRIMGYALIFESIVAAFALSFLLYTLLTKTTPVTFTGGMDVYNTYHSQGYVCDVLSPLRGLRVLSNASSSNAQFTGSLLNVSQCIDYLTINKVCDRNNIFEYISVVGISPRTDYMVTNFLYTPNSTMQLPQTDNAVSSMISMVLPDGSLVITSNVNQVDARITTELLYGYSPSFPKPDVPILDLSLKNPKVKRYSATGGKNMLVIFKEGVIQSRLKLINEVGRCLYPEAPYHRKCYGSMTIRLDMYDSSIWLQYAGNVGMIRIETNDRKEYLKTHRYNTAPYAITQNSGFAVYNGTLWMMNFPGNEKAFGTQNGTFGTTNYYSDFNNDQVINQYYANEYYAQSSKPQLVQISMATGKIKLFELMYSCPVGPLHANDIFQIYYDVSHRTVSVVQMCMNQPFLRAFNTIHFFYLFKVVHGSLKLQKAVQVDWMGSMFISGHDSVLSIEIKWYDPETFFVMTPKYGFLWCSDRGQIPLNFVGSSPYMMSLPNSDLLVLNGNSNLMAVNMTSRKFNKVDYWYGTKYMLVYSFGICNGRIIRSLINITAFSDFQSSCTEPNGFYYQSPNEWHTTPASCAIYQPDRLSTSCPDVKANFDNLVSRTCNAAIQKMCKMQYIDNPPFSCTKALTPEPLSILGSALASAGFIWGLISLMVVSIFGFLFPGYADSVSKEEVTKRETQLIEMMDMLQFLIKHTEPGPATQREAYMARLLEMLEAERIALKEESEGDGPGLLAIAITSFKQIVSTDETDMFDRKNSSVSDTSVMGVRGAFLAARGGKASPNEMRP